MAFYNCKTSCKASKNLFICLMLSVNKYPKLTGDLKFSLGVGFERVFVFSVTLDTRKNKRQMSVSTLNHGFGKCQTCQCLRCNGKQRMIHSQPLSKNFNSHPLFLLMKYFPKISNFYKRKLIA
jgi:hypothetical protein